jgi:hypothetical protein
MVEEGVSDDRKTREEKRIVEGLGRIMDFLQVEKGESRPEGLSSRLMLSIRVDSGVIRGSTVE